MQTLVQANSLVVPEELRGLMENNPLEELKTVQQSLNKKKRLFAKLERLQKAKAARIQAWARYRELMAKTLKEEQDKYEKDIEGLTKSTQETQNDIDTFGEDKEEEMEEKDDLETLLSNPETARLKTELAEAHMRQEEMYRTMQDMQKQMKEYQTKLAATPMPSQPDSTGPTAEVTREAAKEAERVARQQRMKACGGSDEQRSGTKSKTGARNHWKGYPIWDR